MSEKIKKDRRKKMMLARFMCFIMIVFMSALVLYVYAVDNVKRTEQEAIVKYKENAFEKIYVQLEMLRKQSLVIAKNTAVDIETELKEKDLTQIRNDMEAGKLNSDLYDVIYDNIINKSLNNVNNYKNNIIVMSQNGIFEDFNYERATNKNMLRTWESELDSAYNKELERDAVDKILDHSNEIIATEKINHLSDEFPYHKKIKCADYDSLKEVYMREGIEGLKNYQFMSPAYITETGDIFGQEDIVQGVKKYNHKFIIVQEFNLYDQLRAFDSSSFQVNDDVKDIIKQFSATTVTLYILGFFYVASIIALLFYFSNVYNTYIDIYNLNTAVIDDGEENNMRDNKQI